MMATTVAVSILPIGGSTRRSGMISGLVSRRIASANGLRKFARTICMMSLRISTPRYSEVSVSTM